MCLENLVLYGIIVCIHILYVCVHVLVNTQQGLLVMVIMKYCMRLPGENGIPHDSRMLEQCIVVKIEEIKNEWYGMDGPAHTREKGENFKACYFQWHESKR